MDKLLMENYLLVLKSDVEVFVHGTLESSNEDIRELLKSSLSDIMSSQANTFDLMCEYEWYKVDDVDSSVINKTIQKIKGQ